VVVPQSAAETSQRYLEITFTYEPVEIVSDLELMLKNDDKTNISKVHVFPLGGIQKSADWLSAELQSA